MKSSSEQVTAIRIAREEPAETPRVVYTTAPVVVARLVAPHPPIGWSVRVGDKEQAAAIDDSVDVELLVEAREQGARVLLETSCDPPVIIGVVMTRRALSIDREGVCAAHVKKLDLQVDESFLVRSARTFLKLDAQEVEVYAQKVLTRARGTARILARLISLN